MTKLARSFRVALLAPIAFALLIACGTDTSMVEEEVDPMVPADDESLALEVEQGPTVCVLFADDGPAGRFAAEDEPALKSALDAAGFTYQIVNAKGDTETFVDAARDLIAGSCFVLFMTSPDSATGVAVIARAQERGIPVVDYENVTLGGGADYYLGFDLVATGVAQARSLLDCLATATKRPKVVYLNGSPTDVNATLLKLGYSGILEGTDGKKARVVVVDDQSVPDWVDSNVSDIVKLVWARTDGKIDGLVAGNDSLALAAIESIPTKSKTVVVGQGATPNGIAAIVDGSLCATVYQPVQDLVDAVVEMATSISSTGFFETDETLVDIATNVPVPAKYVPVRAVGRAEVVELLAENPALKAQVCQGSRLKACEELAIT